MRTGNGASDWDHGDVVSLVKIVSCYFDHHFKGLILKFKIKCFIQNCELAEKGFILHSVSFMIGHTSGISEEVIYWWWWLRKGGGFMCSKTFRTRPLDHVLLSGEAAGRSGLAFPSHVGALYPLLPLGRFRGRGWKSFQLQLRWRTAPLRVYWNIHAKNIYVILNSFDWLTRSFLMMRYFFYLRYCSTSF